MSRVVQDWAIGSRWQLPLGKYFAQDQCPRTIWRAAYPAWQGDQGCDVLPRHRPCPPSANSSRSPWGRNGNYRELLLPSTMCLLRRPWRSPWFTAVQVLGNCFSCKISMSFAASGISVSEFSSPPVKSWWAGAQSLFPGVWFETLFIIFINVSRIDIICVIFNFWDIIHYFCQIYTLFKWIRCYSSKLIWIYADFASFSPEITLLILGSSRTQPGPQSATFSYSNGSNSPFWRESGYVAIMRFFGHKL